MVSYSLAFADCILVVQFNLFLWPLYFLSTGSWIWRLDQSQVSFLYLFFFCKNTSEGVLFFLLEGYIMHGFSLLGDISYLRPPLPSPQLIRIRSLRLSWRFRDASTSIEGNTPHLLFLVTPWYSWSKKAKTNASSFPLYLPVFKIVGWFPSTSNGDHLFINIFLKIALWIKI